MNSIMKIMIWITYAFSVFQNSVSVPIINNTCCVEYGYGSNMSKCCFSFHDNMICNETRHLGSNKENYNHSCSYVKEQIYNNLDSINYHVVVKDVILLDKPDSETTVARPVVVEADEMHIL